MSNYQRLKASHKRAGTTCAPYYERERDFYLNNPKLSYEQKTRAKKGIEILEKTANLLDYQYIQGTTEEGVNLRLNFHQASGPIYPPAILLSQVWVWMENLPTIKCALWELEEKLSQYIKDHPCGELDCNHCRRKHFKYGMEVEFQAAEHADRRLELLADLNKNRGFNMQTADYGIDGSGEPLELRNINGESPEEIAAVYAERLAKLTGGLSKMGEKFKTFNAGISTEKCGIHIHQFRKSIGRERLLNSHSAVAFLLNGYNPTIWLSRLIYGYAVPFYFRDSVPWCGSGNGMELRTLNPIQPEVLKFFLENQESNAKDCTSDSLASGYGSLQTYITPSSSNVYLIRKNNYLQLLAWMCFKSAIKVERVKEMKDWLDRHYADFYPHKPNPIPFTIPELKIGINKIENEDYIIQPNQALCQVFATITRTRGDSARLPDRVSPKEATAHLENCPDCGEIYRTMEILGMELSYDNAREVIRFIRTEKAAKTRDSLRALRDSLERRGSREERDQVDPITQNPIEDGAPSETTTSFQPRNTYTSSNSNDINWHGIDSTTRRPS